MMTMLTFEMARHAFDNKDYAAATERFRSVLADEPGHRLAREYLARSLFHRALLKQAEAEIRVLVDADPTDEYSQLLLARVLERQGRHDEAASVRRLLAVMTGDDSHLAPHRALS